MRTAARTVLSAGLIVLASCGTASALMCDALGSGQIMDMKKLYKFALLVEALDHPDLSDMPECTKSDRTVIVEPPDDVVEITVPQEFVTAVMNRMEEIENRRARLRPTRVGEDDQRSPFEVGCIAEVDGEDLVVAIGFIIFRLAVDNVVSYYVTGTEVTGHIIDQDGNRIVLQEGTDLGELPQIRANFEGEECVFPAVKETVNVLCEVFKQTDDHDGVYAAFVESNKRSVFPESSDEFSLTLVGHSLGGAAVQYLAENFPDDCKPEGKFKAFEAYAFASPGLVSTTAPQQLSVDLHGYIIDSDWLLEKLFSTRTQTGKLSVFNHPAGTPPSRGHSICEVRNSICSCLQGQGRIEMRDGNPENADILGEYIPLKLPNDFPGCPR